jgi:hypothetical protein
MRLEVASSGSLSWQVMRRLLHGAIQRPADSGFPAAWAGQRGIPAVLPDPGSVLGCAGSGFWFREAFVPQSPDGWVGWFYSVPSWVSLVAELTIAALVLLWVTLPVLLLAAGFDYVHSAESPGWRRRGAWLGAVGAGVVLEALTFPLAYPFLPPTPDWGAFAESLGFVAPAR